MSDPASTTRRSLNLSAIVCVCLFLIALGIRLLGIGWGLKNDLHNQSYHPDEPLIFDNVHQVQLFRGAGDTEYYNYGTLFHAALRGASAVASAAGGVPKPPTLDPQKLQSVEEWNALNDFASQSHLSGRIVSALAGAGTVVFVFLALRRWTTLIGSAAGGALIAFAPAHVMHSRFQTVDVLATFTIAIVTWAALRLLRQNPRTQRQWLSESLLVGLLAGVAASTRYTNILVLLSVLAALWIARPPKVWGLMGAASLAAVVGFLVTTPGAVLDNPNFLADLKNQADHAAQGHGFVFLDTPPGYVLFILYLFAGISGTAVLFGLCGLGIAAAKHRPWAWIVLAFFLPYYLSVAGVETKFLRYGFPMYLGVAFGFGFVISEIQRLTTSRLLAVAAAGVALVGVFPTSGSRKVVQYTDWMVAEDPRDSAARYLKSESSDATTVGLVAPAWFWTVPVVRDGGFTMFQPEGVKEMFLAQTIHPRVVQLDPASPPDFIAYTSYEMGDVMRLKGVQGLPEPMAQSIAQGNDLLDWIERNYRLEKVFGEGGPEIHDLQYIRPKVWVWRRNDLSQAPG